jgi:enoyl-CoA hydratase/carnithine racemase
LAAKGALFCAGVDLREYYDKDRSPIEFMTMCRAWHRTFDVIQFSGIPVIAALQGAAVGSGLEAFFTKKTRRLEPDKA